MRRQLNRIGHTRRPQPQRVDVAPAPTCDRRVVRHGRYFFRRIPDRARGGIVAADIFDRSAEADRTAGIGTREFPRIAVREPILRQFLLPAVLQALLKQAVLIANAVAIGRNAERRHAVHEARSQPAQPAIAERGIGLHQAQAVQIDAQVRQRAPGWLYQAQIRERIEQQPADQKFDRQIIDALLLLPLGFGACLQPDVDDAVAHRQCGGLIPIIVAGRVA